MKDIHKKILNAFTEKYGSPEVLSHAPGRINLIGDHTDYNLGFVLPASIDLGIGMTVGRNGLEKCRFYALDLDEEVEVSITEPFHSIQTGWANYIIGVLDGFKKRGVKLEGFDVVFAGNVPLGSGLSSSAALECSAVFAISELFGFSLEKSEAILIARDAEHQFAGVKCGIMDQFASVMGRKEQAIKLDCRNLVFEYLPIQFEGAGWVLINTRISHSLGDSEYNRRREECEQGLNAVRAAFPEVESLRDVRLEMLDLVSMPEKIYRRCQYVLEENFRVAKAGEQLKLGLSRDFGRLMFDSHKGLSELYEVSCAELDHLVNEAGKLDAVLGSRMMGGGFGGCTLNLILEEDKENSIEKLRTSYMEKFGIDPDIYVVNTADGAGIVKHFQD